MAGVLHAYKDKLLTVARLLENAIATVVGTFMALLRRGSPSSLLACLLTRLS